MNKSEKIGSYGAISTIIILSVTKALISAPSFYARQSLGAGWLEILISGIFELFMLAIVLRLLTAFEMKDLLDIIGSTMGQTAKIIVGLVCCIILLVNTAAVFRSFEELIRNTVIKGISYETVTLYLLTAGVVGAYMGLNTQTSFSGLVFPFLSFSVAVIIFINYSRASVTNILPIFGPGANKVISNALLRNSSFFETGIILFLVPYLQDKKAVKKISFTALAISILSLFAISLLYQLSVPYEAAGSFALPIYQMTRMIKAGTFFQRIEPLNVFIWGGAMFLYIAIGIWLTARVFQKAFNLSECRPLTFVCAFIAATVALIPGSEARVEVIYDFLLTYSYIAYPILPLVLLFAASIIKSAKEARA